MKNEISNYLSQKWVAEENKKYILHVGQTCSGKTYQATQRLKNAKNGCYLAPLRLLAWEIADKLNNEGIKCNLITGEERRYVDGATITSSTVEMADLSNKHEVAVIDECFMVADKDRGQNWLRAILEINADEVHLILNKEVEELICNILTKAKKSFEVKKYERLTKLLVDETPYRTSQPKDKTIFVVFSRIKALLRKSIFEKRGFNVSVLYGNLPPETKRKQMELFISGKNTICIATDVIGMGLNLPCEHVCFLEMEKFDGVMMRKLNPMEIKQIGGRAGRYGYSDVGYVCATQPHHINMIKHGLNNGTRIQKAFFGLDLNMFNTIPKDTTLEKLIYFKKLNCIPNELKPYVEKQNIDKMIEIAQYKDLRDMDMQIVWMLINCPIKKNNEDYFGKTIHDIKYNSKILFPEFIKGFKIKELADITKLENYESNVSEIDLFTYFWNNEYARSFMEHISQDAYDGLLIMKAEMVDRINQFLVDKSKSNLKTCPTCDNPLDITWPHKLCNECFHSSRRNYY